MSNVHPIGNQVRPVKFTLIQSTGKPISKVLKLGADGLLEKAERDHVKANLSSGNFWTTEANGIDVFAEKILGWHGDPNLLMLLGHHATLEGGQITYTGSGLETATCVARRESNFGWRAGEPTLIVLDFDVGLQVAEADEADRMLTDAVPYLRDVRRFYKPSSSSHVLHTSANGSRQWVNRKFKWHCFIAISDNARAKAIGEDIFVRTFEAGHGRVKLGNGTKRCDLNDYSLIDKTVFQGSREVFEFGGIIEAGSNLAQPHRDFAETFGSVPVLDVRALPALRTIADWQTTSTRRAELRAEREPERIARNAELGAPEVARLVATGMSEADARRRVTDYQKDGETLALHHMFELWTSKDERFTPEDVYRDPVKWSTAAGIPCRDPMEPEYSKTAAKLYAGAGQTSGEAWIHSHAHGLGRKYVLSKSPEQVFGPPVQPLSGVSPVPLPPGVVMPPAPPPGATQTLEQEVSDASMMLSAGASVDINALLARVVAANVDAFEEERIVNKLAVGGQRKMTLRSRLAELKRQSRQSAGEIAFPDLTATGSPRKDSIPNALVWFEHNQTDIWFNEFACSTYFGDGEINDHIIRDLRDRMHRDNLFVDKNSAAEAVETFGYKNRRHPVQEYFNSVADRWDGQRRAHLLFPYYCNVDHTPAYQRTSQLLLIGIVMRVFRPGCKFDYVPALYGPEGTDKSEFCRTLAVKDDWLLEGFQLGWDQRTMIEQTSGVLIAEYAEMAGHSRKEVAALKDNASRRKDRARRAYDRYATTQKRSFIPIANVNSTEFLMGLDGQRRYWPFHITQKIRNDELKRDIEQIYGEAVHLQRAYYQEFGDRVVLEQEHWAAMGELQEAVRIKSSVEDDAVDLVARFPYGAVRASDVYKALNINQRDRYQIESVQKALNDHGWVKNKLRLGGHLPLHWFQKGNDERERSYILKILDNLDAQTVFHAASSPIISLNDRR